MRNTVLTLESEESKRLGTDVTEKVDSTGTTVLLLSLNTEVEAVVTLEKEEESNVLRGNVSEGLVSAAADPSKFKKFLRFLRFASKRGLLSRGNDRLEDRKTLSVLIDGLESSPDTLQETVVWTVGVTRTVLYTVVTLALA